MLGMKWPSTFGHLRALLQGRCWGGCWGREEAREEQPPSSLGLALPDRKWQGRSRAESLGSGAADLGQGEQESK